VCLSAALFSAAATTDNTGSNSLRVDERATRVTLRGGFANVSLAVENATARTLPARVRLELRDTHDKAVTDTTVDATLRPGASRVEARLNLAGFRQYGDWRRNLLWYRLRYRVEPAATAGARAEGVVSLSEVTRDVFELRVASPRRVRGGQILRARVRAVHPLTSLPVKGVRVEGEAEFDDERGETVELKSRAETDSDGACELEFKLPPKVSDDDLELSVEGRLGDVVETASDDIDFDNTLRVLLTTDKPLYQPGQTLHARALVVTNTDRAVAGAAATLKVEDPEGTVVFRAPLKTSRFGVASADWAVPEGTRLGDYSVRFEMDEDKYDEGYAAARVRVSRYELPNFSVAAKPDRDYYLRGQQAAVEVSADYLFGQPVRRGRVRVVRESERSWNYREQKYDVEEGEKYEGELDDGGRFVARVDLGGAHAKLAENTWSRFEDLTFAAYVTDPTTNRTEQRRFTLRLTRDPIHVYVTGAGTRQTRGLPLEFYVTTAYADGRPAQCDVTVSEQPPGPPGGGVIGLPNPAAPRPILRTVRTNRFGIAKLSGPLPAPRVEGERRVTLAFNARDREGRAGKHVEEFWLTDEPVIRVKTDRAIYRAGEPIAAEIISDRRDLRAVVEVVSDGRSLHAENVRLSNGRARLTILYRPEFQNRVTIAAYTADIPENSYDDSFASGTHTVIYPRDRELKLDVDFTRAAYRPGEEAEARLSVRGPSGRASSAAALGVVVFDKAVEERARTDQEFASGYGFYDRFVSFWYGGDSVAGVTPRDLERLDPARPRPAGFDLVAELLLQRESSYEPNFFGGSSYATSQAQIFEALAAAELNGARLALVARYERDGDYPADEPTLRRLLKDAGVEPDSLRDPWGTPYRAAFSVERENDVLEFATAGADKQFGTGDDWKTGRIQWPYFRPTGLVASRAVAEHHKRTGGFLRDAASLKAELRRAGLDFDSLRDRWGRPYELRFGVSGSSHTVNVVSAGPDGQFSTPEGFYSSDDFSVWMIRTDYFSETRERIDAALAAYLKETGSFPKDERTFSEVLRRVGLRFDSLRDPWGRAYYAAFRTDERYADRVEARQGGQAAGARTQLTPVTRRVDYVNVRSAGADGQPGTWDDPNVAEFSTVASEQSARDAAPKAPAKPVTFAEGTGAIGGTVTDPQGASVPGATVTATHQLMPDYVRTAATDEQGEYLLRNLPAGLYTVKVEAAAFKTAVVMGVAVYSSSMSKVDLRLEVGGVSETVEVTSSGQAVVEATTAQISSLPINSRDKLSLLALKPGAAAPTQLPPVSTPRLRKDFPETLYWQPELVTDKGGRSEVRFKLADNITTWKMSVIASNESGEIGTVEKEFRAFQPFFVELDPPPVLTEGDRISLPVVVRNYLDARQQVALELKPETWFALTGPASRRTEVPAGDSARETFDLRAVESVNAGRQQVTARGGDDADAVEKSVRVHPDGEERSDTATQLVGGAGAVELEVPARVIPRSLRAELKVYPNLLGHVVEGVEAIMARPYGCAEQTISSTYPSLLILRHHRRTRGDSAKLPPVAAKAERYLQQGYDRLLSYREPGGGFSYWGRGDADTALTAYALRFLQDARELIEVDEGVIASARSWLVQRQRADGSWAASWDEKAVTPRSVLLTAYVARVLAADAQREGAKSAADSPSAAPTPNPPADAPAQSADAGRGGSQTPPAKPAPPTPLARALDHLARRTEEIDEPYLLASYALALAESGADRPRVERTLAKLRALARPEAGGSYWSLETNTPFYGWGLAGRIETTALAVQALAKGMRAEGGTKEDKKQGSESHPSSLVPHPSDPPSDDLVGRGLLFLLRNKDAYGVWHSTQATVNVFDALMLLSPAPGAPAGSPASSGAQPAQAAEVFVNGQSAGVVALPAGAEPAAPVVLDITRLFAPGVNRVEIRRGGAASPVAAQVVANYYVPWSDAKADGRETHAGASRSLRLAVAFDRTRATAGEEVTCTVEAERIGHRGYGMLLAEVGLPPGADVDRASLERAMKESGWELGRYDVLPDRLVVYLWPRAGGTRFRFSFRPRFGLSARSAPSQIYDYYNPEARALLAPTDFVVTEQPKPAQARR
jgi:hypothetical protein